MKLFLLLLLFLASCDNQPISKPSDNSSDIDSVGLGFGLARHNLDLAEKLNNDKDFIDVMLGPSDAETLRGIKNEVTLSCIFRSLEQEQETIRIAEEMDVVCDYLGYNPETTEKTPPEELEDFIGSVKNAKQAADDAGSKLLVGPGMSWMIDHEEYYKEASQYSDAWMIQSQAFEIKRDGTKLSVDEYSSQVRRVAGLLREGNPDIVIWVQFIISPGAREGNTFTTEEVIERIESIKDDVDAVRIYLTSVPEDLAIQREIIEHYRG